MSVIDLILDQPLILVSLGVVFVPLILAVLLWFVGIVRRILAARAQSAAQASAFLVNEAPEASAPVTIIPEAEVVQEAPEETAEEDDKGKEEPKVSSAMQDLLSSVFNTDAADERYSALMDGLEPAELNEIQALMNQLAGKMGVTHA